jgi:hypothetical protein
MTDAPNFNGAGITGQLGGVKSSLRGSAGDSNRRRVKTYACGGSRYWPAQFKQPVSPIGSHMIASRGGPRAAWPRVAGSPVLGAGWRPVGPIYGVAFPGRHSCA